MGPRSVRTRCRLETVGAALTGLLAVVTLFEPDWIETVTGTDPDHGTGTLEVTIVVALAVAALLLATVARSDYRRARRTGLDGSAAG